MKGKYVFSSDLENVNIAEKIVEEISDIVGLNEELYGNTLLSLSEAITNAIIHGNKFNRKKKVYVDYEIRDDKLILVVSDEGEGFDVNSLPDPTSPENLEKLHKRGIFIIRHMCDELEFKYENGQKVIMKFNLAPSKVELK